MKRRAYESAPLPITLPLDQYLQGTNDQVLVMENENAVNLREFIKLIGVNDDRLKVPLQNGEELNAIPSKMLSLDIDKEKVLRSNIVPDKYKPFILDKLVWNLTNSDYVDKKTLIILDMIATSNWERPIYFSTTISPSEFLNLKEYTQLEGMAYRLLPVKLPGATDGWVDTDIMYNNMMNKFFWRNLNNPKVYYNEWYYSFTSSERLQFDVLAEELIKEEKKDKAKQVLNKALELMPDNAIPYDEAVASYVPLLFKLGEKQKATEIINTMGPRLPKALEYADKINDLRELQSNLIIAQRFSEALREQGNDAEAKKYEELFSKYLEVYKQIRSEY
jgi:tetratricopeptide (TPR) repeat protein